MTPPDMDHQETVDAILHAIDGGIYRHSAPIFLGGLVDKRHQGVDASLSTAMLLMIMPDRSRTAMLDELERAGAIIDNNGRWEVTDAGVAAYDRLCRAGRV